MFQLHRRARTALERQNSTPANLTTTCSTDLRGLLWGARPLTTTCWLRQARLWLAMLNCNGLGWARPAGRDRPACPGQAGSLAGLGLPGLAQRSKILNFGISLFLISGKTLRDFSSGRNPLSEILRQGKICSQSKSRKSGFAFREIQKIWIRSQRNPENLNLLSERTGSLSEIFRQAKNENLDFSESHRPCQA